MPQGMPKLPRLRVLILSVRQLIASNAQPTFSEFLAPTKPLCLVLPDSSWPISSAALSLQNIYPPKRWALLFVTG